MKANLVFLNFAKLNKTHFISQQSFIPTRVMKKHYGKYIQFIQYSKRKKINQRKNS